MAISKFKTKLKAIMNILNHDEFFVVTAYEDVSMSSPGCPLQGPIRYKYVDNTDRDMFYIFAQDYIKNNKLNKK